MTKKNTITFSYEDIEKPHFFDEVKVTDWLYSVASHHGSKIKNLHYIFCDDEYMLEINKEHLNHDYYTDIITFPYEEGKTVEADILISLDRVKENASDYGTTFRAELMRVMVHGLLHLIGFSDKTEDNIITMRSEEDKALLSCALLAL
ncbi:MAG TPA: rRNA maturation RNase YbeY [Saprospiraceae bacterium]|nr:rRNA maturation RNase YbeY [Saprospiraceae bacterium]